MKGRRWDTLNNLIAKYNYHRIAEIGVYKSQMMERILKHPDAKCISQYWAIDTWRQYDSGDTTKRQQWQHDSYYINACILMVRHPAIRILRMDSVEASKLFYDQYFDMVFIDCDHRYENVKADIYAWIPKVLTGGGILSGHDYTHKKHTGVKLAVDEIFGENNIKLLGGNVWVKPL